MIYNVKTIPRFDKEIKRLVKKYVSLKFGWWCKKYAGLIYCKIASYNVINIHLTTVTYYSAIIYITNNQRISICMVLNIKIRQSTKANITTWISINYTSILFTSPPKFEYEELINKLEENPEMGISLGNNLYKVRLAITSKGKGKSGGARIITYLKTEEGNIYLLTIYDKSEKDTISNSEIQKILVNIQ